MNSYTLTEQQIKQIREAINEALADAADSREQGARNIEITNSSYRKLHEAHLLIHKLTMAQDTEQLA